jgi:hypothetical protein
MPNKCPVCLGTGKQTTKMSVMMNNGEFEQQDPIETDCIWCDDGVMTDKQKVMHHEYETMWCKCEPNDNAPIFYRDGEHDELHKHHYRCTTCHKVIQIG